MDFVCPAERAVWPSPIAVGDRTDFCWHFVDVGCDQLHHDDHSNAGSRNDHVPIADDGLGIVYHGDLASLCAARFDSGIVDAADRSRGSIGIFCSSGFRVQWIGSAVWWPATIVATLVLVLFASGRVRNDFAGNGNGVGYVELLFPQASVWLPANGILDVRDRRIGLYRLGPSHVHFRNELFSDGVLHAFDNVDCVAEWNQSLQLAGDDLGWTAPVHGPNVVLFGVRFDVYYRRAVGNRDGRSACRHHDP